MKKGDLAVAVVAAVILSLLLWPFLSPVEVGVGRLLTEPAPGGKMGDKLLATVETPWGNYPLNFSGRRAHKGDTVKVSRGGGLDIRLEK